MMSWRHDTKNVTRNGLKQNLWKWKDTFVSWKKKNQTSQFRQWSDRKNEFFIDEWVKAITNFSSYTFSEYKFNKRKQGKKKIIAQISKKYYVTRTKKKKWWKLLDMVTCIWICVTDCNNTLYIITKRKISRSFLTL